MKKIIYLFTLILAVGTFQSCEDYLDINDPLNDPIESQVTPDLILAGAMTGSFPSQSNNMNRLGNVMMNNWAGNINAFTGGFNEEYQLIITSTFYNFIWDGIYLNVANFQAMIDADFENYENHKAIAKIMKSYYMQYVVDLYGDAPYTEAFQGGDNPTPTYDDDMEIYRALITEVDEALALIDNNTDLTNPVGSEDVVYNGNMTNWVTFANTLKLRILMRQSTLAETDGETASYLATQFQALQDASFITTTATINPGYANDTGRQNPFYGTYGFNVDGSQTTTNRFIVASLYAEQYLDGTLTGILDPRINELYTPVDGEVQGVQQGVDSNDPSVPDEISPLGEGLLVDASQDGVLFSAAESFFLQSEAVFRGYIAGDAKGLFQDGIRSSFDQLGIADQAEAYITNSDGVDEIGWDGSANKIEAIMTQKWIATNGINAIESFIDMNRTNFPEVPLAINAQRDKKPTRLLYPSSESIANAANKPAQETDDAFNTYIFWDSTQN
jgi:hypothetical protein